MPFHDKFLEVTTKNNIKRMLEAFSEDKEAYFMVINAPNTEVPLFPGEVGKATLILGKQSHYGVPRIEYQTSSGNVHLFPHEAKPIDMEEVISMIANGDYHLLADGRYMPSVEVLRELYITFGSRIGLLNGWEERYNNIHGK